MLYMESIEIGLPSETKQLTNLDDHKVIMTLRLYNKSRSLVVLSCIIDLNSIKLDIIDIGVGDWGAGSDDSGEK